MRVRRPDKRQLLAQSTTHRFCEFWSSVRTPSTVFWCFLFRTRCLMSHCRTKLGRWLLLYLFLIGCPTGHRIVSRLGFGCWYRVVGVGILDESEFACPLRSECLINRVVSPATTNTQHPIAVQQRFPETWDIAPENQKTIGGVRIALKTTSYHSQEVSFDILRQLKAE